MAYEVLARKWRPKQFDEIVGQDHVTRTLKNAIETGRIAHAYIFVGSRGTGKTTTARILAKALNCEKGPTPTPCDRCDSCREIMAGRSLDVIEIDGASNNSVDQIRELRDNVRYAPTRGPYKIYIIDEVHMLSISAFNALLKTLEEPPPHVKFLFATTDVHKVPATILSRCQRFDLRRISIADIVDRLRRGCEEEGIEISENALLAIARTADGGLRDAESALDQLISFRGKKIDEEDVLEVFGLISRGLIEELVKAILAPDIPAVIRITAEMDHAGKDLQRVVFELLEEFRNLLVVAYAGEGAAEELEIPAAQLDFYRTLVETAQPARLLRIIDVLVETDGRMRYALSRRTLLETGLIRAARAARTVSLDELIRQVARLRAALGEETGEGGAGADAAVREEKGEYVKKNAPLNPEPETAAASSPPGDVEELRRRWKEITDRTARIEPVARRALVDTAPLELDDRCLVVGYDPEFARETDTFDTEPVRLTLARAVEPFLHFRPRIVFRPLPPDRARKLPSDHPAGAAAGAPADPLAKWYADPLVRSVVETFNGQVTDVRE